MKCFICGMETEGEVCDRCLGTEQSVFHREWDYKEGFFKKKIDSYKVDITSCRIMGNAMICNNDSGLNGRVDAFNHYVGNVEAIQKGLCDGREAIMIRYKNPVTQMQRYIFFLGMEDETEIREAVYAAKEGAVRGGGLIHETLSNESKIERLEALVEEGILTTADFERAKAKIVS